MTAGELYGPAMGITAQQEANEYFDKIVNYLVECGRTKADAVDVAKANLGYYSAYYSAETMERVQKLFNAYHPVFGPLQLMEEK